MRHVVLRRLIASVLLAFALLASACSGDSGSDETTAETTTSDQTESAPAATEVPAATEEPATEDTEAAQPATEDEQAMAEDPADASVADEPQILTPSDAQLFQLNQASFGLETSQAEIDCMQVYFTYELAAGRTYFSIADPELEALDDQGLRDLAYASNGCVANENLYGWAIFEMGATGEALANGPVCLTTWFGDEIWGDTVFHSFTALRYQYRLDPDARADLINSLVDCAPASTLTAFFAEQAEFSSDFTIDVDQECLFAAIDNADVSLVFWDAFVTGGGGSAEVMAPYIDACTFEFVAPEYTALPDDFAPFSGARQLSSVDPALRNGLYAEAPPLTIDPTGRYEAIIATGGGEVRITLLADIAPNTVNNFVNLANDGFYDGLGFHRVVADFMVQAGDPNGDGSGGPGYFFADEVEGNPLIDRKGMLAMANSGVDTNGSQFFITTASADWLNGLHTVFGIVISGQEYIDAIEPLDPLAPTGRSQTIDSITIVSS